ncbi:MarR family transcriptional regulator [uncultured Sneathiella sp.]|uniref:MarR family winged helix-turn-helix transcriptional regulator n=1 Tax=uncultured Sneathiella sp. TaxID=879315 RepID=UPI002592EBAE|nr:MarR family transcriptional regulator [uncultured Sneathiella sp.]
MSQGKIGSSTKNVPEKTSTMESILEQWRRERPDIDPSPMAVCGQIWRAGEILRKGVTANWANYGLDLAGSDVILTLRRQGRGATLSPSDLAKDMMLSTSAMTNRLDRLEKRGLVKRTTDPKDRRGLRIILTDEGFALADEMVATHVATEEKLLSTLTKEECSQIRQLLSKIEGAD